MLQRKPFPSKPIDTKMQIMIADANLGSW